MASGVQSNTQGLVNASLGLLGVGLLGLAWSGTQTWTGMSASRAAMPAKAGAAPSSRLTISTTQHSSTGLQNRNTCNNLVQRM